MDIKVGDTIKWSGKYFSGYESGINKVKRIYEEDGFLWMELDNSKLFAIENTERHNSSFYPKYWTKISSDDEKVD